MFTYFPVMMNNRFAFTLTSYLLWRKGKPKVKNDLKEFDESGVSLAESRYFSYFCPHQ